MQQVWGFSQLAACVSHPSLSGMQMAFTIFLPSILQYWNEFYIMIYHMFINTVYIVITPRLKERDICIWRLSDISLMGNIIYTCTIQLITDEDYYREKN